MKPPLRVISPFDLSPTDAVSVGLRAYGFVYAHGESKALGLPTALESATLVAAIDQLIRDEVLLGRFSERTGFALETTYAARRYLSRPSAYESGR